MLGVFLESTHPIKPFFGIKTKKPILMQIRYTPPFFLPCPHRIHKRQQSNHLYKTADPLAETLLFKNPTRQRKKNVFFLKYHAAGKPGAFRSPP
jgi:hypothetical protein